MSGYALELWDSKRDGVPANFDKAVAIAASLRSQPAALTPALIEFNQYYYDYLVKNQENIDSPYFVENQLRHKNEEWPFALLVVDLPDYGWEPMLKELVSIANQLGLVVFSNDFASFFLPNGKILPPSRKKIWQGFNEFLEKEQDFPTTRKAFTKLAHPMVDVIIRRHGFEPFIVNYPNKDYPFERFDYQKEISNLGTAKIHVQYQGGIHEFKISVFFDFISNIVYDVYSKFIFDKRVRESFSVGLSQDFIDRYKSSLWNITDKIVLAERLVLLNKVIINIFGNLKTIKDLDDLVNGNACEPVKRKIRDYWMSTQHALIIARLANNPEFEQLAIDLQKKGTFIEEWPKFVKYLREKVQPIEHSPEKVQPLSYTNDTTKDIPAVIKDYLNKRIEQIKNQGSAKWELNLSFQFWLIENDYELIEFLRSGLLLALTQLLSDVEENAQIQYSEDEYEEDDEALTPLQRQELTKYPPVYAAICHLFVYFVYYRIHRISLIANWADTRMKDVIVSFKVLGLHQIADAYAKAIQNLPTYEDEENDPFMTYYYEDCQTQIRSVFEEVMEFSVNQQELDVAKAVRKNYQLFLASVGWAFCPAY